MERLLLFPLNGDTEVLLQNKGASTKYQITAISSYYEDVKRLEELENKNSLYCSVDFKSCLKKVDTVLFAENTMGHEYSGYKTRVEEALNAGKNIYLGASLMQRLDIDPENENINILQKRDLPEKFKGTRLKDIGIPILAVMGEGENCDKFKLQVNIKTIIEKKGYTVLSICSNLLGQFIGMEALPGFLFSENLSLQVKIEAFNNWIYKQQENSKADIIVLGCPGGILEFDEYESNHYGEIPLAILNAVISDKSILTIYSNCKQDDNSMKDLSNFCQMRYNTAVEEFVISGQYFRADHERKIIKYHSGKEQAGSDCEIKDLEMENLSDIDDKGKIERQVDRILMDLKNNFFAI